MEVSKKEIYNSTVYAIKSLISQKYNIGIGSHRQDSDSDPDEESPGDGPFCYKMVTTSQKKYSGHISKYLQPTLEFSLRIHKMSIKSLKLFYRIYVVLIPLVTSMDSEEKNLEFELLFFSFQQLRASKCRQTPHKTDLRDISQYFSY